MDQLTFNFTHAAGNKLTHVSDAITNDTDAGDFRDRNTATNDYDYWPNGDLKKDLNKDITLIDYNFLRLPKELTLTSSRWLKYHYTASGQKLRKQNSTGEVWDYVGEFVYKNSSIHQITHEEGRIANGKYEYNYTDHLGNLRLSFRDSTTAGAPPVVIQENHYSPFGLSLKGVDFQNTAPDNYKFSQNEQQNDFGINLYDFGARFSDPTTGNRFLQIDPLAEISRRFSPYIYANSNPLRFIDPDGMSIQNIQDFDGNWHIVNKDEVNNLYTAPEEGDGDEKGKKPTSSSTSEEKRPQLNLNDPTNHVIFFMDQRDEDDPTRLIDDFFAFLSPYKALEGLVLLAKMNPFSKGQAAAHLAEQAIKKWTRIFNLTAKDDDLLLYSTRIGDEVIEFGGNFSKSNKVLTIKNFDVDGNLTNKLGIRGLKEVIIEFGRQQGVNKIIIEGAKRTTGANPGKIPSKLTFNVE